MKKRDRSVLNGLALMCAMAAFAAACGGTSSDTGNGRKWACRESDECSCQVLVQRPGSDSAIVGGVDACSDFSDVGCCLLSQTSSEDSAARCNCFKTVNDCAEEAKYQPGGNAVVVSQCPPLDETPPKMCIAEGVACRWGLPGDCCAGTLCRPNAAGVQVCQAPTKEDLALGKQCTRVAKSHESVELEVLTPTLRTSVGVLSMPDVRFATNGTGPNGCLNEMQLTLQNSGVLSCSFDFTVKLQGGKLVVTNLFAQLDACPGFVPPSASVVSSVVLVSNPAIDVNFQGLACDGNLIFESYCVAGTFDFHISQGTLDSVTVEDQHLIIKGVSCYPLEPKGECPTP